jgi:hypothetical protein
MEWTGPHGSHCEAFLCAPGGALSGASYSGKTPFASSLGALKFFVGALKPKIVFLISQSPPRGGFRGALWGPGTETGTGRVRCLIPILLFGGFGYAHL